MKDIEVIERLHQMVIESLDGEALADWARIKEALRASRKGSLYREQHGGLRQNGSFNMGKRSRDVKV